MTTFMRSRGQARTVARSRRRARLAQTPYGRPGPSLIRWPHPGCKIRYRRRKRRSACCACSHPPSGALRLPSVALRWTLGATAAEPADDRPARPGACRIGMRLLAVRLPACLLRPVHPGDARAGTWAPRSTATRYTHFPQVRPAAVPVLNAPGPPRAGLVRQIRTPASRTGCATSNWRRRRGQPLAALVVGQHAHRPRCHRRALHAECRLHFRPCRISSMTSDAAAVTGSLT